MTSQTEQIYRGGYYNTFSVIGHHSPEFIQPCNIKTKLFVHQLKALHKLIQIENTHCFSGNVAEDMENIYLKSNMGIYADKVGAGKTLVMASLIASNPSSQETHQNCITPVQKCKQFHSATAFVSYTNMIRVNSTLVIVPHSLTSQWENTLRLVEGLDFTVVKNKQSIENLENIFLDVVGNQDTIPNVIIISHTAIKKITIPRLLMWNRIIIDEPQSLALDESQLRAGFLWLICATPCSVLYSSHQNRSRQYLSRLVRTIEYGINTRFYNLTSLCVVKNPDAVVDESIKLPQYIEQTILCKTPSSWGTVRDNIPDNVLRHLDANDIQGAIQTLTNSRIIHNTSSTSADLIESLIQNYKDKVHNTQLEITRISQLRNITEVERTTRLTQEQTKLDEYNRNIQNITNRVTNTEELICSICLDTVTDPRTVTNCCQNSFCLKCIVMALTKTCDERCPYCRAPRCNFNVHSQNTSYQLASNELKEIKENKLKSKTRTLMNLLKSMKSSSRYLIFSEYDNTFKDIEEKAYKQKYSICCF